MKRAAFGLFLLIASGTQAADMPYGLLDIALGSSYMQLERALDLRDINAALAAMHGSDKPDLGRRGYGCLLREDEFADIGCVSHDERLGTIATREVRLQFLAGRLQQISLTAEARYFDAVLDYLRRRYGAPQVVTTTGLPRYEWRNAVSNMYAIRGPDLVFVSLELASYQSVVARKREHGSSVPECR